MADESLFDATDAIRLVRAEAVDYFNIKLSKSGGIFEALKINAIAEAAGVPCMVSSTCVLKPMIGLRLQWKGVYNCRFHPIRGLSENLCSQADNGVRPEHQRVSKRQPVSVMRGYEVGVGADDESCAGVDIRLGYGAAAEGQFAGSVHPYSS